MINNERGSTLLVVMLMMLVFTILGLSIISTSIGGAKRTEVREQQVTDDLEAIRNLGEAVAYIKKTVEEEFNKGNPDMSINSYQTDIINDKIIGNRYGYQIKDISGDYHIDSQDYTRVLQISSGHYKQIVYVTGMPSFLKYAVGSRGILTLNGSIYVEKGNIYAKDGLYLSNQAKYIYRGIYDVQGTSFPSMAGQDESYLFIGDKGEIKSCDHTLNKECYSVVYNPIEEKSEFNRNESSFEKISNDSLANTFTPYAPIFSKEDNQFVDVDIEKTFKEKLKVAGFIGMNEDPLKFDIHTLIDRGYSSSGVKKIKSINEITEHSNNDPTIKGYLYSSVNTDGIKEDIHYIDTETLTSNKWIVIDGDAVIEQEEGKKNPMVVSANILVKGNLNIRGNIAFNSTIYVRGSTSINNANIAGFDDGELILMTQEQLEIARINKFNNNVNSIKAYLYTNDNAEVYAVGSYLHIEGGLFAQNNLEVNVFRGLVGENFSHFTQKPEPTSSRLKVINSKRLFVGKEQTFPKINSLEVIAELMTKN